MNAADIAVYFFDYVQALIQPILLCVLLARKPKILPLILFTALNFAAIVLPLPLAVGVAASTASLILCCRLALCESRRISALYGVLSAEMMWLGYGIIDSLFSILIGGFPQLLRTPAGGIICLISSSVLSVGAYLLLIIAAHKIIQKELAELQTVSIVLIPLALIFTVEIYIVKALYGTLSTDLSLKRDLELLFVQLLGAASVFCVLFAYKKCAENLRIDQKMQSYEYERALRRQYSLEAKERYDSEKSLRHDFKNHILIIGELLRKGQFQSAEEYASALDKTYEKTDLIFHTGSQILDIIFNIKLSKIADKVKINIEALPEIDETDICTIFANALDNAVRAVSNYNGNDGFISVTTKKRGDMLFIEIENSFDGKPFKLGTGLENIITAAEKYGGTAKFSANGSLFSLRIIICNSQH